MKEDYLQPIVLASGFAGTGLRVYRESDRPMEANVVSTVAPMGDKHGETGAHEGPRRGRPRIPENQRKMFGKQSTYRLAPESKAQLQVIINVLKTSSEVAALQIAINYLFEHLNEIAPLTATPDYLAKLFAEEMQAFKRG